MVKSGDFEVVKIANFSRLSGALFFRCIIGFMPNYNKNLENVILDFSYNEKLKIFYLFFFFRVVLGFANRILGLQRGQQKWSVESVHTKNIVSILHLLVALARHFRY